MNNSVDFVLVAIAFALLNYLQISDVRRGIANCDFLSAVGYPLLASKYFEIHTFQFTEHLVVLGKLNPTRKHIQTGTFHRTNVYRNRRISR